MEARFVRPGAEPPRGAAHQRMGLREDHLGSPGRICVLTPARGLLSIGCALGRTFWTPLARSGSVRVVGSSLDLSRVAYMDSTGLATVAADRPARSETGSAMKRGVGPGRSHAREGPLRSRSADRILESFAGRRVGAREAFVVERGPGGDPVATGSDQRQKPLRQDRPELRVG